LSRSWDQTLTELPVAKKREFDGCENLKSKRNGSVRADLGSPFPL